MYINACTCIYFNAIKGLFVKTQEFRYSIITLKNCAQLIYLSAVDLVTI